MTDLGIWRVRWSGGVGHDRPNSARLVDVAEINQDRAATEIDAVESFYARHGARTSFQLPLDPGDTTLIEKSLANIGYEQSPPSDVYTAPAQNLLTADAVESGARTEVVERLGDEWLRAWADVLGAPPPAVAALRTSLAMVQLPTAYCTLLADGIPAAVGRASCHEGWTGFFNFATAPPQRGRRFAGNIVRTLAEWGAANGSAGFYLQVDGDNRAAKRAYAKSGFRPFYRYHYLKAPLSPASTGRTPA